MLLLIGQVVRLTGRLSFLPDNANLLRLGLGLGFLNAFVYQGLTGSDEDARHLWILLGLLLASAEFREGRRDDVPRAVLPVSARLVGS